MYDGWLYHFKPLSLGIGANTGYHGSMLNLITKDSNNVYLQFQHILNTGTHYSDGVKIGLDEQTGIGFVINQQENSYIKFLTDNTERMIISSSGNIGIGIMSPSAKLHLNGNFMLQDGTQGQDKVLLSDNNGLASWQTLQLSLSNNILSITGGSNVDLSQYLDNTDNQTLSVANGHELTISNGNTVTIDINDADSDPTNELQTLSVNNGNLQLSGNNSAVPLDNINYWRQNGNKIYYNSGFVGIGTHSPSVNLQIYDDNYYDNTLSDNGNNLFSHTPTTIGIGIQTQYAYASLQLTNKRSGSGSTDGVKLELKDYNTTLRLLEHGNINFTIRDKTPLMITSNGEIRGSRTSVFLADKNGANSYSYAFLTRTTNPNVKAFAVKNGSGDKFVVYGDGRVGIGTQPHWGYMLSVKGKIIAEEVKVKLNSEWPDYVFSEKYHLLSINDLKNYIKANKHLPGLPSEAEVKNKDIDLLDINIRLLKKVEELTLYIIYLEEKINRKDEN